MVVTTIPLAVALLIAHVVLLRISPFADAMFWNVFAFLPLAVLVYFLARHGFINLSSGLIVMFATTSILLPLFTPRVELAIPNLYFLGPLYMFCCLLFRLRIVALVIIVEPLIFIVASSWMTHVTLDDLFVPLIISVFVGAFTILLTFVHLRWVHDRVIERRYLEQRYRDMVDAMRDLIFEQDAQGRIISINIAAYDMLGWEPEELIGCNARDIIPPDDHPDALALYKNLLTGGAVYPVEHRLLRRDGSSIWIESHVTPHYEHGRLVRISGVARDITARKQAEAALRLSEERYRILVESISDYAFSSRIAADGSRVVEWMTEESFAHVTGYRSEDVTGSMLPVHPEDVPGVQAQLAATLRGEPTESEHRIITRGGEVRWIHIVRKPIWDEQQGRVIRYYAVAQDVTERKVAELALQQSEARYKAVSGLISDYAYYTRVEPNGDLVREWMTDSIVRVTGYTPEELAVNSLGPLFAPEERERVAQDRLRVMSGEAVNNEYQIITKGGEKRWLYIQRLPVWDERRTRVVGYYAAAQDVTERKLAEERRVRLTLEHERMNMIGQLVLALSHDFRTSLATIETSRYLIERMLGELLDDRLRGKLGNIQQAVGHMGAQLDNLHMISSLTRLHPMPNQVKDIIDSIVNEMHEAADQRGVSIRSESPPDLPLVTVDGEKLRVAARHLVLNAIAHSEAGQTVYISGFQRGAAVGLSVRDEGLGIDEQSAPHIFDLFYRGDEARNQNAGGIGVGLTIVKMIAEAHQGSVEFHSKPGSGSVFTILIPIAVEAVSVDR
ncbi:MAG: PAS domain S-box protein [Anaerolineae bacterium]|nr:PAS domain S-box protein [Anaerolineae bacterium]